MIRTLSETRSENDVLLDDAIFHAHFVEKVKSEEEAAIRKRTEERLLIAISAILSVSLIRIRTRGRLSRVDKQRQYSLMMDRVKKTVRMFYSDFYDEQIKRLSIIAENEFRWQGSSLGPFTGKSYTPSSMRSMVISAQIRGRTLKEWLSFMERDATLKIERTLRSGFADELVTAQLVEAVNSSLSAQLRYLSAIARTAITRVNSEAREMLFQEEPAVKGVEWVSILDSRTTEICTSRNGNVYPVDDGPRPPAHMGCRSITTPILLGDKPQILSYRQWIRRQSKSDQDKLLGARRAKSFRNGTYDADRFVVPDSLRIWTTEELKTKALDIVAK